jgi:hypothetical protein
MGHSEPSVSQNVYGHHYQGWQEKLGNEMDRLRQEAEAKRSAPPECRPPRLMETAATRWVGMVSGPRVAAGGHGW